MLKKAKIIGSAIVAAGLFLPTQVLADQMQAKGSISIEKPEKSMDGGYWPTPGPALVVDPAKKTCATGDKKCSNRKAGEKN
ncbi:MAG: hypothetical protein P1V21_11390 [Rhizobiaceae bacterium]|nr:hypothetical protein [Rhizobiaceae bacterium]